MQGTSLGVPHSGCMHKGPTATLRDAAAAGWCGARRGADLKCQWRQQLVRPGSSGAS